MKHVWWGWVWSDTGDLSSSNWGLESRGHQERSGICVPEKPITKSCCRDGGGSSIQPISLLLTLLVGPSKAEVESGSRF